MGTVLFHHQNKRRKQEKYGVFWVDSVFGDVGVSHINTTLVTTLKSSGLQQKVFILLCMVYRLWFVWRRLDSVSLLRLQLWFGWALAPGCRLNSRFLYMCFVGGLTEKEGLLLICSSHDSCGKLSKHTQGLFMCHILIPLAKASHMNKSSIKDWGYLYIPHTVRVEQKGHLQKSNPSYHRGNTGPT